MWLDESSSSLLCSGQTRLLDVSTEGWVVPMANALPPQIRVFVSYSHADAEHLTRLHVHLAPFVRQRKVDVWDDRRIRPGTPWREQIAAAIAQAKVAILLISADFLASEFINGDEMPPLLEAAESQGTLIVSVILSPSAFRRSKL